MNALTPNKTIHNKNLKLFDTYLINFQQDIKRIVGKFKKSFHALSDEEVYSECNIHILKNKDKIVESFGSNQMSEADFKKIAYHYAKNEVVWSHYRFTNQSYNKRKVDGVANTEDGPKTSFEIALENEGEENKDIDNDSLFFGANAERFFHVLKEYSYLLTEQEMRVVAYIKSGLNQDQIAEKLSVTHQAISFSFLNIKTKLNSHFNLNEVLNGGSEKSISKGISSLNSFFDKSIGAASVSEKDRKQLKKFLLKNPKCYAAPDLNKILFNNKLSNRKIWGVIKSLNLSSFVCKKRKALKT